MCTASTVVSVEAVETSRGPSAGDGPCSDSPGALLDSSRRARRCQSRNEKAVIYRVNLPVRLTHGPQGAGFAGVSCCDIINAKEYAGDGWDLGYKKAIGFVPVVISEMVLYGMNLSLSTVTITMLLRRKRGEKMTNARLLLTLTLMLTIATTYIVLNTLELYPKPDSFYTRSEETRQYLTLIQAALGDSVTIWRCYIIYGRSIVMIALPVSTALASFIFGMYLAGNQAVHMSLDDDSFSPGWFDQSWIWAAITMVCTIYCAAAISYRIYSSAYLTRNNNLFAVMFFIIETSFIYTVGVVTYVITTFATQHDVQDIIMGAIVQLPPIVLCLLLLQTKFYSRGSRSVHYVNPDTVGPLSALRRIFKSRREVSDSDQMSTFRVAPGVVHDVALSMPMESHPSDTNDTLGTNDLDSSLREDKVISTVIHIV